MQNDRWKYRVGMKKLRKWMIENYDISVWEKYKEYLYRHCKSLRKYAVHTDPEKYIVAFEYWSLTNEGNDYWKSISDKWNNYLNNYYLNMEN